MTFSINKKLRLFVLSLTFGGTLFQTSLADDTEVFFGQASPQNILLVLDLSGSMKEDSNQCTEKEVERTRTKWHRRKEHSNDRWSRRYYRYYHTERYTTTERECDSKLEVLKESTIKFLNGLSDAHVGLVTYPNSDNSGGDLVFKISELSGDNNKDGVSNRDEMIELIKDFSASSYTPIAGTLATAANYYRGDLVGSDTPIKATCALANNIVLLTDGAPNKADSSTVNSVNRLIGSSKDKDGKLIGKCDLDGEYISSSQLYSGKECSYALAKSLGNNDQVSSISNSNVSVSTIAFGIKTDNDSDSAYTFMKKLAGSGNGTFSNPDNVDSLVEAFVTSVDTSVGSSSFVAPSVPLSQSNRLRSGDEVYLAMFQPLPKATWPGNLKKYYFKDGVISSENAAGSAGSPAVDGKGQFLKTAQSAWNQIQDGNFVVDSGVASNLVSGYTFTNIKSNNLTNVNNKLTENLNLTDTEFNKLLGVDAVTGKTLLKWFDNRTITVPYGDSTKKVNRFGDPLHSQPKIINYSKTKQVAFIGTNQGYLHAVNVKTGSELWSFVPRQLLDNTVNWQANSSLGNANKRKYGMDGDITLYKIDANNDGDYSDSGDKVYLFAGMRRGGSSYYAIDVTDSSNPKMLFTVQSSLQNDTTDSYVGENIIKLANLGQSWSKPIIGKIKYGSKTKTVMMFGGGYDTYYDDVSVAVNPAVSPSGNSIYIIDLDPNEDKSFSDATLLADINKSGFKDLSGKITNSIASDLTVLDLNNDGLVDKIYAADVGGKIYRVDLPMDGDTSNLKGGVFADVSNSTANRFYYKPDVTFASYRGQYFGVVSIGSGARFNPLNAKTSDRFYSFFDKTVISGNTPKALKDSELLNVSNMKGAKGSESFYNIDDIFSDGKIGWYINMATGEKVLTESTTINFRTFFTTYSPKAGSVSNCSTGNGLNKLYGISLLDGQPIVNVLSDGTLDNIDDRSLDLTYTGIAPGITTIFAEETAILSGTDTICYGEDCDLGNDQIKTVKWKQEE